MRRRYISGQVRKSPARLGESDAEHVLTVDRGADAGAARVPVRGGVSCRSAAGAATCASGPTTTLSSMATQ